MKNWKNAAAGKKFAASFSGGKDSTLALYRAMQEGSAKALISMFREEDGRAGAHGVTRQILELQAKSLGLPLYTFCTDWEGYGSGLIHCIQETKKLGCQVLVTGDIDLPEHHCWYEKITRQAGVSLAVPLWKADRRQTVKEFLSLGFITKVVSVNLSMGMTESDLGRILTWDYLQELEDRQIDCCGEAGEFHTIVLDGPVFRTPVKVRDGEIFQKGANLCLNLEAVS